MLFSSRIYKIIFLFSASLTLQFSSFAQETIVIFAINDPHSEIENFAKIKPLIDAEKAKNQKVYFVAAGDLFSGNPIVDYHQNKGYPMIDMLNKTGLDVSVIGNHEFDYGQEILNDRLEQANFPFICDNVSGGTGKLGDIKGSTIITKDNFSIAFVGVVETGSPGGYPLTHPKKIEGLSFTEGLDSFENYKDLKVNDDVDLIVALTHYGSYKDEKILENYDFVFELINLSNSNLALDNAIAEDIDEYFNNPRFYTNIGSSLSTLTTTSTGCFYTDALQKISGSDMVIQNFGGIRNVLEEGTITPFSIYSIDPFGNGFDTFSMTVPQLRNFLNEFSSRFAYSLDTSFSVQKNDDNTFVFLRGGDLLDDSDLITLSLNDYISSVFPALFPASPTFSFPLTTADYLIEYLTDYVTQPIDYLDCSQTNNTLSIANVFNESVVKIYPLYIEINLKEPVFSTEIYSITGQLLHKSVNTNKIDTQFLTKGIYLLKLNSKNGSRFKFQKFMK